jgi:NhaP-type Na+/H+ or K+/H+ antiporter
LVVVCWHPSDHDGIGWHAFQTLAVKRCHGLSGSIEKEMITLTLVTIAASIIAHGTSVVPLMSWYAKRKAKCHDALGASTTDRR